jgi:hypothetical protein
MTAPEPGPGGLDSNVRGLLVLGVAIVVGALLLWSWGDDSSTTVEAGKTSTSTTVDISGLGSTTSTTPAAESTSTTAPASDHSPSEVSVVVLNGSGQTGVAASTSATIGEAGYNMLTPGNAPALVDTTAIYYAEGYEADAIAVANVLGKGTDAVKPVTEASLGGAEGDADVAVVLGKDTPPASGGSTGSTGSSTSTTIG